MASEHEATVEQLKDVVQRWLDKQGHDRCHYYPELFAELAGHLGLERSVDALPTVPLAEFRSGCKMFQEQEYGVRIVDHGYTILPSASGQGTTGRLPYDAIIFDYGDTLALTKGPSRWRVPKRLQNLIAHLHASGYVLAIISNAGKPSDGRGMRRDLQKDGVLSYFSAVLTVYGDDLKPNPATFQRMLAYLRLAPERTLFVGNSVRCDGGCQAVGMHFLHVELTKGIWDRQLRAALYDEVLLQ